MYHDTDNIHSSMRDYCIAPEQLVEYTPARLTQRSATPSSVERRNTLAISARISLLQGSSQETRTHSLVGVRELTLTHSHKHWKRNNKYPDLFKFVSNFQYYVSSIKESTGEFAAQSEYHSFKRKRSRTKRYMYSAN